MRRLGRGALLLLLGAAACRGSHPSAQATSQARTGADSLILAADSLYAHEKYDSARATLGAALALSRSSADPRAEARALTLLGLVAYWKGDDQEAQSRSEEALDIKNRLRMTAELFESYNTLGLVAKDEGRYREALDLFGRAIAVAREQRDGIAAARALGNLGETYTHLGQFERAREDLHLQRATARALGNVRFQANALLNEANLDVYEGYPRVAVPRLDSARDLYRRDGYATGEQYALSVLATLYELTGEDDRAFAALDSAIAIARQVGMHGQEAEDLRLLGGLHARDGDYRRAVRYFDEAEARAAASGSPEDLANALRGSADAHLHLDDLRQAKADAVQALRLHTASGEPLDRLDDLLLLARIEFRTEGPAAAEPRLRAAYATADRLDTRASRIAVALGDARLADLAGNPHRVLRALQGAGADVQAGDFGSDWEAAALAARAWARLGRLDSAAAAGRRAVAAVNRLRGGIASEEMRGALVADRAQVYADLVLVLLELKRTDEAFQVADAARSQELLSQLLFARIQGQPSALPREMLESDQLLRVIDSLVQQLRATSPLRPPQRGSATDSANASIASRLETARGEYEELSIRMAQERPRAASLLGSGQAEVSAVRAALQPEELLVDYLVTPNKLLTFAMTGSRLQVVHAPLDPSALVQRIRLLHDLWGAPRSDWRWGLAAARALDATLIGPLRDAGLLRGVSRLLIVPDGILGQVPFAALVDTTGRFLADDFSVVELPSAASLPALREGGAARRPWDGAAEGLAPFPDELPATRREIAALRAALPRAALRSGPYASERALRRALATGAIVHVATHGILNVRNPMFSRIELARPRIAAPDDDGRLEVHEVLGLEIRSPLVFLSGCETGAEYDWTADPVRGTGELTLAQAFLAAGADNVILTLWRIDDAGAAAFASAFYEGLAKNPLPNALTVAQQRLARTPQYASPYYWAGYMLAGAGSLEPGRQAAGQPLQLP